MQKSLFDEDMTGKGASACDVVRPSEPDPALVELARALPPHIRLGTSSWHFPGWNTLVWRGHYSESELSRHGLSAYSRHPLLRTVSIDRGFYRPLTVAQYARYAAQVPEDFRFVVKAPSVVTDPLLRAEFGKGASTNPYFLDPVQALTSFIEPALEGLQHKLGALVFQISPLPAQWLNQMPRLIEQLHRLLNAIPAVKASAPDGVIAVEVRDAQWLTANFVDVLRGAGATYCLGLHAKMPRIEEQLPLLRALWPGPLVCRWNLNPRHGAYGYEAAKDLYSPFDSLVHPDTQTRTALTRVIQGTASAGQNVFVTISNKAEGSAPLSVIELAREIGRARQIHL